MSACCMINELSVVTAKANGLLVKRLRRRPLTAKTGVRFPYKLLTVEINSSKLTD